MAIYENPTIACTVVCIPLAGQDVGLRFPGDRPTLRHSSESRGLGQAKSPGGMTRALKTFRELGRSHGKHVLHRRAASNAFLHLA